MRLSDSSRDTVSKGSTASGSLSCEVGRANDCDYYYGDWSSRDGSPVQSVCVRPRSVS